jgi:hypothetical protein
MFNQKRVLEKMYAEHLRGINNTRNFALLFCGPFFSLFK